MSSTALVFLTVHRLNTNLSNIISALKKGGYEGIRLDTKKQMHEK